MVKPQPGKFDKKSGQWKGGDQGILSAVNMGFTMDDLILPNNPFGFVSAYTNTLEKRANHKSKSFASWKS
jgi:hypothetical protein